MPVTFTIHSDNTVTHADGRIAFFGMNRFISEIASGTHCFICGRSPSECEFNAEHILPKWVLHAGDLFAPGKSMTLPNGKPYKYGLFTIPCCVKCNGDLNMAYEQVIKPLIDSGYAAVARYLDQHGSKLFFQWLALIYLKTHLLDTRVLVDLNRKTSDGTKIGDLYDWATLHHVHCIARVHHSGAPVEGDVGTFMAFPADTTPGYPAFDYADLYDSRTIMLRVGEVAFFAVLNDAGQIGGTYPRAQALATSLRGTKGLTPLQIREMYAEVVFRSLGLRSRPRFYTEISPTFRIVVERAGYIDIQPPTEPSYGQLLYFLAEPYLIYVDPSKRDEVKEALSNGTISFFTDHVPAFPDPGSVPD